jgi:hypothetical protein
MVWGIAGDLIKSCLWCRASDRYVISPLIPRHCFSANFGFERQSPCPPNPGTLRINHFLFFRNGMDEMKDKFAESDVLASGWSTCEQARAAWRLLWQS